MKISNINKTTFLVAALYFLSYANANEAPDRYILSDEGELCPFGYERVEDPSECTRDQIPELSGYTTSGSSGPHTTCVSNYWPGQGCFLYEGNSRLYYSVCPESYGVGTSYSVHRLVCKQIFSPTDPDVNGDPHFRTWSGESYDFHGACDLVLLKNAQFDEGLGMDIHIRSKRMNGMFSYVDSASVRIGDDTLEVRGGKEGGLWMNGEKVVDIDNDEEAVVFSDKFPVAIEKLSEKAKEVRINLGGAEAIVIRTWNKMVRVSISHASNENFGTSLGMMGAFSTGAKLGRDGITNIKDFNIFGQEWQVLPTEAKLFHEIGDAVQSPARCEIPSSSQMRRRLSETYVTVEESKIACDGVAPADLDLCMFDVMASNDKNLAGAY